VWAEVKDDPMLEDTLLLKAFAKRGLTDQFHKQKKKAADKREKMPLGLWKHYHEFMGEYLEYYQRMNLSISETKVILENGNETIEKFSEIIKRFLGVEMHSREIILNESYVSSYKMIETNKSLEKSKTKKLFNHFKILKEKREWASYYLLKDILENEKLSKELEFTTITYLGSFLKWSNLNNDEKAGPELIKLYNYGLLKNILFPNKIIPLDSYALIITIGSNTGNSDWSEKFIENYAHQVSDKNTDQIKCYGLAHLSYIKGNFQETLELLRSRKFNDNILELKAKWLLISSLYELDPTNNESFKYYTSSLRSFIKRNKEKSTIEGDKAFLTSLKYLDRLLTKNNLLQLEEDLKKEQKMIHKRWFLKKVKGLQEQK